MQRRQIVNTKTWNFSLSDLLSGLVLCNVIGLMTVSLSYVAGDLKNILAVWKDWDPGRIILGNKWLIKTARAALC
jgi:hypothetical protein